MSWGTELWDQFDNVAQHAQKGIDFCEKYARFVKERCDIENEYAGKLKKLGKSFQPKKKEEEDYAFTCSQGFLSMVNEVHDMAGQHEMIAENLTSGVMKQLQQLVSDLKQERKKHLQEFQKIQSNLQTQQAALEKAKKQYEKSFRNSENASEAFKKADADIHLSRLDVEKAKNLMHTKQQQCEDCKKEYALELQRTNDAQRGHYSTLIPQVFQGMEDFERRRITEVQQLLIHSSTIERNVIPIINTCIDGIQKAAQSIDPEKDHQMVIDRYKSGFVPPGDIPFEDLSNGNMPENSATNNTPKTLRVVDTFKGTQSGNRGKKRGGLFNLFASSKGTGKVSLLMMDDTKEDYSHLPPTQQKKKLLQKIDTLKQMVAKETAERDGMIKMRDVYSQNSALGDPSTIDKQLEENAQKIDKVKQEMTKFEGYLQSCDERGDGSTAYTTRKMSDMSLSSHGGSSNPGTPVQQHNA